MCGSMIKPGVTPDQIDRAVFAAAVANNTYPSPLNYRNFPKSVCVSVNEVICHGIPDTRPFQDGDIVNIDVTVFNRFHGDCNATFYCGKADAEAVKLVECARQCLAEAIKMVKPGTLYRDLGKTISKVARRSGMSVVKSYCGHGVHRLFHTAPNVPHYAPNKAIGAMKVGHVFTIEPMINAGSWRDTLWPDDWTAVTEDGQRSAQFEHTLVVTKNGYELLTSPDPQHDVVMSPTAEMRDATGERRVLCPPHLAQFARDAGVEVEVAGEESEPNDDKVEETNDETNETTEKEAEN